MSGTRKIFLFVALPLLIVITLVAIAAFRPKGLFGFKLGKQTNTCPTLQMPVETSKVSSVLYPGQTRGGDYKKHGGFRIDGSTNEVVVRAPIAGKLTAAGRYIEQNEVQNIMDFKTDCGLDYRFDHLLTLAPKFQEIMNKQPEAKVSTSNTYAVRPAVKVETGEVIATAVGFRQSANEKEGPNVSFDFGVYLNNEGLCWLGLLPAEDTAKLKTLPGGDFKSGKQSDYCQ